MKYTNVMIGTLLCLVLVLGSVPIAAGQTVGQNLPPAINFKKVALLKWYAANLTTNFPVGSQPFGVAFDGTSIWVTNQDSNNVTKLRASDGFNLGTFNVGSRPQFLAFDGANIWVGNQSSNSVTKLRTADGADLGTFSVGLSPEGVAFDGTNIWVANQNSNNVTKLRAADGANLGTFNVEICPAWRRLRRSQHLGDEPTQRHRNEAAGR